LFLKASVKWIRMRMKIPKPLKAVYRER